MLKNASILRLFYEILLGSEQLQYIKVAGQKKCHGKGSENQEICIYDF